MNASQATRWRSSSAALELALASLMISAGGVLLGVQLDQADRLHGTGYTALASGILVALVSLVLAARRGWTLPRDLVAAWSAIVAFLGVAFVVAGVLVPSGPWLFVELVLLIALFSRGRGEHARVHPSPTIGATAALTLMLIFKLWISYQASEGRFELLSVGVPVLSWLPFAFLDPFREVPVGGFGPDELALPPSDGLNFPLTSALWALGFAQVVCGLWWRAHAAREHEDDRIHATIQTLPPALAKLVETLLPESDWVELGLHGLSQRKLEKRIEELVRARVERVREVGRSLDRLPVELASGEEFAREIGRALDRGREPGAAR